MDIAGAEKLANESGNGFQSRVANAFRKLNWAVLISPFYVDSSTDKTRELDMIVEKRALVQGWVGAPQSIHVRLFIECKYIAQGTVFWVDSIDEPQARDWIHSHTCFPPNNVYTNSHHYLTRGPDVAKLFATERQKGDENDPMFRTINQCLHGFVHNKSRDLLISASRASNVTNLDYPVVMCSSFADNFYQTRMQNPAAQPVPITTDFAFEVNYAYTRPSGSTAREYFLLDIVDFTKLDDFLNRIDQEISAATSIVVTA